MEMKINYGNIEQWAQRLREVFVPSQELASVRRRREEAKKKQMCKCQDVVAGSAGWTLEGKPSTWSRK